MLVVDSKILGTNQQITDLNTPISISEAISLSLWDVLTGSAGSVTCAGQDWFGGPGFLVDSWISKTYDGLPAHHSLEVSFQLYFGDSWTGETFLFVADGVTIWQQQISGTQTTTNCGAADLDKGVVSNSFFFSHDHDTFTMDLLSLSITSPSPHWWAINNILITPINTCATHCLTCNGPNANDCLSCDGSTFLHIDGTCITNCPSGYYGDTSTRTCTGN